MVNRTVRRLGMFMIAAAALLALPAAVDQDSVIIHPFVASTSPIFCTQCHPAASGRNFAADKRTCDTYCKTCHGKMEGHHATGIKPGEKMKPGTLRLSNAGTMSCSTCHTMTLPRFADRAYRSRPPVVAMLLWQRKHRTYYLPVRNNRGQLCMVCH